MEDVRVTWNDFEYNLKGSFAKLRDDQAGSPTIIRRVIIREEVYNQKSKCLTRTYNKISHITYD